MRRSFAFDVASLRHVAEDQHRAEGSAVRVSNGRSRNIDGSFGAILGNEQGVVRQADRKTFARGLKRRIADRLTRVLIDDLKHLLERLTSGFLRCPAGQLLRNPVEKSNAAVWVRRDDSVANTGEGRCEPVTTLLQLLGQCLAGFLRMF